MAMTLRYTAGVLGIGLVLLACKSSPGKMEDEETSGQDTTYAPVETKDANTDYSPAFEGQTRIAGVKTSTPYQFKVLSEDLDRPWGIASMPDGRFLITQQEGTMRIDSAEGTLSETITGLPEVNADGPGGLLVFKMEPSFSGSEEVLVGKR